jgi:hypothetical protein
MNGITGEGEFAGANLALAEALREGRHILVVRREEIEELASGEDLAMLLRSKRVEPVPAAACGARHPMTGVVRRSVRSSRIRCRGLRPVPASPQWM